MPPDAANRLGGEVGLEVGADLLGGLNGRGGGHEDVEGQLGGRRGGHADWEVAGKQDDSESSELTGTMCDSNVARAAGATLMKVAVTMGILTVAVTAGNSGDSTVAVAAGGPLSRHMGALSDSKAEECTMPLPKKSVIAAVRCRTFS